MTEYLTADDIVEAHQAVIGQSGGAAGLRDRGSLESAAAQPLMAFSGQDLYESLEEKAAALGYSLILNHPFVDGNKRVGHAAMATFLLMNGRRIVASVDEQEKLIVAVAADQIRREQLVDWLRDHVQDVALTE